MSIHTLKLLPGKALSQLAAGLLFSFFMSCNGSDAVPDVSAIRVELKTRRLDADLAAIDTTKIAAGLNALHQKYTDFLDFYLDTLLGYNIQFPYVDTSAGVRLAMRSFLTQKDCRGLLDTVRRHYPDTKNTEADIKKGLQYLRYYDSSYRYDKVVYFTTCLNSWGVVTYGQSTLGIGLDMFLGQKYPFYASVGVPDFMTRNLEEKNIPVNVFKAIYEGRYPLVINDRDLLSLMLQKGKEQYFLKKVLPFVADSVRFGYTSAELEWCRKNEAMVYNFFVQQKMIYDKNQQKVVRYVVEGPQAAGMPHGSPGNVGVFIGLKIIEAYLNRHPDTKLNELLTNDDDQVILQEAHYNPR